MRKTLAILSLMLMALAVHRAGQQQAWAQDKNAPPEPKYKVGDTAPDFTLLDQNRKPVTLSSFKGNKSVALAFYVFAFTGG